MSRADFRDVRSLLEQAVESGVTPGAALVVGDASGLAFESYVGNTIAPSDNNNRSAGPCTLYDLASLTKVLATVPALLSVIDEGLLGFDTTVVSILPKFAGSDDSADARATITVADLLGHSSGLPAHRDYCSRGGAKEIYHAALSEPLLTPPRQKSVYSDIGFLVLGRLLEKVCGADLATLVSLKALEKMGADSLGYLKPASARPPSADIAACGYDQHGNLLQGRVNDDNARAMGSVAPHAGLFGTAADVYRAARSLVDSSLGHGRFKQELIQSIWQRPACTAEPSTWRLGWDTPSAKDSTAGNAISAGSVGHLGFTGTSLWIDIKRGVQVVLLTNRVHLGSDTVGIKRLRPAIHDAVFAALDAA